MIDTENRLIDISKVTELLPPSRASNGLNGMTGRS